MASPMASPTSQSFQPVDQSILYLDGPPSSPFVSELDAQSRNPSNQWKPFLGSKTEETVEQVSSTPESPRNSANMALIDFESVMEDKENMPQVEETTTKLAVSPKKMRTPEPVPTPETVQKITTGMDERRGSTEADLMPPPPSIRKAQSTPKRSPLKPSRSAANTPRPISRGNSYERPDPTSAQSVSSFQAGLDLRADTAVPQDATSVDDTCFSTFSEIPEMTLFAKLGQSPTKTPRRDGATTPRTSRKRLSGSRSPSPTSRRQKTPNTNHDGNTTFLIDFTQQLEGVSRPYGSPSKSSTEPNLLQYINNQRTPAKPGRHSYATPAKQSNIMNLLDFELPPAPTPRSIPTITVRELESLKSSYLSQISSLKATLSGREAEVESLKRAVGDAERRCGEAQEAMREERSRREHVEQEKAGWERRGQEVESVLKSVKEEVLKGEAEKEELLRKVEDTDRRVEDAEARATKAEERFADALAARADSGDGSAGAAEEQVQRLVASQIDAKIEAVSRELHAVYKEKHERKVGTLKKSYEARSEKKCAELASRVAELERANDDLVAAKDATFSGPVSNPAVAQQEASELKAELEEHKAVLARLENEMCTSHTHQEQLMRELEKERIEKGDLVAAVDEMLLLQAESGPAQGPMSVVEDFRRSISRPSGLRQPGASNIGESRIGKGTTSFGRSVSGAGKSRMLAKIERMGRNAPGSGLE